jgi:hypothetical protein
MSFVSTLLSLPVLSVRQPWASYLVSGLKTVELRTWVSSYRGWLWIHAGKKPDMEAMRLLKLDSKEFPLGGLIGLAKLEDHVLIDSENKWLRLRGEHRSPGYYGGVCHGWEFSDAISLDHMIECPGELGLFRLKEDVSQRVLERAELDVQEEFVNFARDLITALPTTA